MKFDKHFMLFIGIIAAALILTAGARFASDNADLKNMISILILRWMFRRM